MQISIKVIAFQRDKNKYGEIPVYIQAIGFREVRRKLIFRILPEQWNKQKKLVYSTHLNAHLLNNKLAVATLEANKRALTIQTKSDFSNFFKYTDDIERQDTKNSEEKEMTITQCVELYIEKLERQGEITPITRYKCVGERLFDFFKKKDVPISSLDLQAFLDFKAYLKRIPTIKSKNTLARQLKTVKTLLRFAKYHKKKGVEIDQRIFGESLSGQKSLKTKLTIAEINAIEKLKLTGKSELYRDIFIFEFYMRGLRISDVLTAKWSMINNRILDKGERKTEKRNIIYIEGKVWEIINKYKGKSPFGYIFPLLKVELPEVLFSPNTVKYNLQQKLLRKNIGSCTALINKALKHIAHLAGIKKEVTTHVARHSFGIAARNANLTLRETQLLLNHSKPSTTEGYLSELAEEEWLRKTSKRVYGENE